MERIFLSSPHMSDEGYEKEYIHEAFDKNFIAPLGANVDAFEKELVEYLDASISVALSSGTSALHMALMALDVSEGDIVFCQSLTFSATVNPVRYLNATPVFIDSEFDTWNMSPEALEKAFIKYPNVKAVIVVHLYGIAANMNNILELCNSHNVPLIEDAAESLGTIYKGRYTGTLGTAGIFSFNGNKIITTSGGGMLVWNKEFKKNSSENIIKKVKFWATQAKEPLPYYEHKELGFNYRLSNILAGIGRGQMKVLDQRIKRKRAIYEYYKNFFSDSDFIEMMPLGSSDTYSNCWLSSGLIKNNKLNPTKVIDALSCENIEARHIWKPMHTQPYYKDCDYIDNNRTAEYLFDNGVCLPSDTKMTQDDLLRVCQTIEKIID